MGLPGLMVYYKSVNEGQFQSRTHVHPKPKSFLETHFHLNAHETDSHSLLVKPRGQWQQFKKNGPQIVVLAEKARRKASGLAASTVLPFSFLYPTHRPDSREQVAYDAVFPTCRSQPSNSQRQ